MSMLHFFILTIDCINQQDYFYKGFVWWPDFILQNMVLAAVDVGCLEVLIDASL